MLYIVLMIFALATGTLAVLAFENSATLMIEVHLTLFGWRAPVLPLGALLLLSCLTGALLLYIVTVLSALRDRRALAKLRRRVAELEQQAQAGMAPRQYSLPMIVPMPGIHRNQTRNTRPPYPLR
ncbi:MAG TPA: lipopolysaccharide assembly protein LapA domain-containing protein [Ktedonobacteraceae bacterium]|nr:lipopolysaccharide assembly protein LapA domain-containing protein [Ktedonobacteraceae bacterium]